MSISTLKSTSLNRRIGFNGSNLALGLRAGLNDGDPDDIDDLLIDAYLANRQDYKNLFETPLPTLEELQAADPNPGTPDLGGDYYVKADKLGVAGGVATLDSNGKLSGAQIPDGLGSGGGSSEGGNKSITLSGGQLSSGGTVVTLSDFSGKTITDFLYDGNINIGTGFSQAGAVVTFSGQVLEAGKKLVYRF